VRTLMTLTCVLLLAACGQKGSLYFPPATSPGDAPATAPATPDDTSPDSDGP
jgi:predicted small lipoprotein YifL